MMAGKANEIITFHVIVVGSVTVWRAIKNVGIKAAKKTRTLDLK
jgi:hypothetical protein